MKFVPRRYPLTDHLPLARISPVGTNHTPVSPKNVVVAGRVSSAAGVDEDGGWVAVVLCPVDVPEDPLCALAPAATASANAQAMATRLAIVGRLHCRRSNASIGAHAHHQRSLDVASPVGCPAIGDASAGGTMSRPRPPRLTCPPLRPADRASSADHSWAVPFSWAARPPLLAISRCFSGDIDANPRRSLRSPVLTAPPPSVLPTEVTDSNGSRVIKVCATGRFSRWVKLPE